MSSAKYRWTVVLKRTRSSATDGHQLIARIPGECVDPVAGQVAVEVVGERGSAPLRQLVGGTVAGQISPNAG